MTKTKRKLYRIKEMRRQGLTYEQRAAKIAEFRRLRINPVIKTSDKEVERDICECGGDRTNGRYHNCYGRDNLLKRLWDWLKSLFYGKTQPQS